MSRKRIGIVREDSEQLRELEEKYRGQPQSQRIRALRLLAEDPPRRTEEVAAIVGCSEQSIKRWWRAYRRGGIDAVLRVKNSRRKTAANARIDELQQKLLAGDFDDVVDIWRWMLRTSSRDEAEQMLSALRELPTVPRGDTIDTERRVDTIDDLLTSLNSLVPTGDIREWVNGFRTLLHGLLPDVDHISVSVNMQCDLITPERYEPSVYVLHYTATKQINIPPQDDDHDHAARILEQLRVRNFQFDKYHLPHPMVLHYGGSAYLGVLLLWRERELDPISEQTLQIVHRLRPFLTFMFSDLVARHRYDRPIDGAFNIALDRLVNEAGLTLQEQRIVVYQTLGYSYEQMADMLNISLNTIRHHLKSVYNKTGTHSQSELFAKYFTPAAVTNKGHE